MGAAAGDHRMYSLGPCFGYRNCTSTCYHQPLLAAGCCTEVVAWILYRHSLWPKSAGVVDASTRLRLRRSVYRVIFGTSRCCESVSKHSTSSRGAEVLAAAR